VGAINADQGFMLHDHEEAEFARQIARQATMRIVVADSSKFGRTAPMILDAASHYHCLVTDADPPADIADVLRKTGTDIRIAGQ
jgi:DeoR family glycerol-3-phosphate regulon repressor